MVSNPHHFVVDLPVGRTSSVVIAEAYGIKAGLNGLPEVAERCYAAYNAEHDLGRS